MADTPFNVAELIGKFTSRNGMERREARRQLVEIGKPAVARVTRALSDSSKQVRWEAAKTLEQIADPEAAPQLALTLGDAETDVRWVAGEALIALKRQALVPVLDAVSTKPDSVWMFDGVHHVLRELAKDREMRPILQPVLDALATPTIDEREILVPVEAQKAANKLRGM